MNDSLSVFAPAKLNLFLHVTGKRGDGYHLLQSLAAFADIGDQIILSPAPRFSFSVTGPFAHDFSAVESEGGPDGANLVVRAAHDLARALGRDLMVAIKLVKNLPLAAGLGGGSADAAAAIWGLLEWWDLAPEALPGLPDLMLRLGADVPVCFSCRPAVMEGIGDVIRPVSDLPEVPVLLVNPHRACPTARVFGQFTQPYAEAADLSGGLPGDVSSLDGLLDFLAGRDNMLAPAAVSVVPEIAFVLNALQSRDDCRLARMSGSGATCFGLFSTTAGAMDAAAAITALHPEWWVKAGTLNRPARY